MDTKLKSLKVVDLRDILSKASVSVPAKANKQDLISRVIANPAALDLYNQLYPAARSTPSKPPHQPPAAPPTQTDDLLAPPEDVDWTADEPSATDSTPDAKDVSSLPRLSSKAMLSPDTPKSSSKSFSNVSTINTTSPPTGSLPKPTIATEDEELEKRKARAARFDMPLVDTTAAKPRLASRPENPNTRSANKINKSTPAAIDDPEKLKARGARFGTATSPKIGQKRAAPVEEVDAEELEKRKMRAERFGFASGNKA